MRNTLARRQLEIIKRHFRYKADEENHNRWCYRTKDYTSLLILYFRSYSNFCAKIAFFSCIAENISVFNKIFAYRRKSPHFHHFFSSMDENFEVSRLFQSYFLAIHFGKTRVPITRKGYNLYSTLNSHFKDVMEK